MNRLLFPIVVVAVLGLVGFAIFVFATGGQRVERAPAPTATAQAEPAAPGQPAGAASESPQPEPPVPVEDAPSATTPEATARFDAWAKRLRDAGLVLSASGIGERGDTVSVSGLTIEGPDTLPRWRWTVERAALYDREPFHLQAAGQTTVALTLAADTELSWTGRVDAFGIALQKDTRDVLSSSIIFRVNGLTLQGAGDTAPLTLADGQLRLLLGGGTGLLPSGTRVTLRLTDMTVPAAAGTLLGTRLKSFTTEFALNRSLMGYAYTDIAGLFGPGDGAVTLGLAALDWGPLHFSGDGDVRLSRSGTLDGHLDVRVSDVLTLLDAIAAAGVVDAAALSPTYAALLLELGRDAGTRALPFRLAITPDGVVLAGDSRGLEDLPLGRVPGVIAVGTTQP